MQNEKKLSRWLFLFFVMSFVIVSAAYCASSKKDDLAAKIGDKAITMAELDEAAKSSLFPLDAEMYQIRKSHLDEMVAKTLFELEAKTRGKSVDEIKASISSTDIVVSEDEIQRFYNDNNYYFRGTPYGSIKGQIRDRIYESKVKDDERRFLSDLKKKYGVEIYLKEPKVEIEVGDAPARGPKGAKVTLVEFSDFQCPYCSRFSNTVDRIVADYPEDVRHVFRHNPLPMHSNARAAHQASICAQRQGKFWEYREVLFKNQNALNSDQLKNYAESVGLNLQEYDACMADSAIGQRLEEDLKYAQSVGADGTPTSFINGRLVSGARPYEEVKAIVEEILHG